MKTTKTQNKNQEKTTKISSTQKRKQKEATSKFLEFYEEMNRLFTKYKVTKLLNTIFKKDKYFTDTGFEIWGENVNGNVDLLSKISTFMVNEEIIYLNWIQASNVESLAIGLTNLKNKGKR